uniref:Uncharacterized protein n=1 Tax=Helianthus annuus TaxID=4232 RepID=A0A251T0A2_HELAN
MDFSYPTPNHVSFFVFKGHRFSLFSHLILLIFLHRFLVTSYMFLAFISHSSRYLQNSNT